MIRSMKRKLLLLSILVCAVPFATFGQDVPSDYQGVLKVLDRKGDFKANVLKVNIPRNDLKMTIQGVPTPTPFGFGGWIALTKTSDGMDVMMGDLVLLQEEVSPVMSAFSTTGSKLPRSTTISSGTTRTCTTCTCTAWARHPILLATSSQLWI